MGRSANATDVTPDARRDMAQFLAARAKADGSLQHGAISEAMARFGRCRATVTSVWRERHNLRAAKRGRGRPPMQLDSDGVPEKLALIAALPEAQRQSVRAISDATGIPRSTVMRLRKLQEEAAAQGQSVTVEAAAVLAGNAAGSGWAKDKLEAEEGLVVHRGGCHCRAVEFELAAPKELTQTECNCSFCGMRKGAHVVVPAARFRLVRGLEVLTPYSFASHAARHLFCSKCGVQPLFVPREDPNSVAVTVACIQEGSISSLKTELFDGKSYQPPAVEAEADKSESPDKASTECVV